MECSVTIIKKSLELSSRNSSMYSFVSIEKLGGRRGHLGHKLYINVGRSMKLHPDDLRVMTISNIQ